MKQDEFVHPYIPNSVPRIQEEMLAEIGVKNVEDFYNEVPEELRFKGKMELPEPLLSEYALKRHTEGILNKNTSCHEVTSFLGGGCAPHFIPAICDEINQRSEFLTAYAGEPYEDHGRFQVLFEYCSMMGELLDMEVVNVPTYDWSQAAATSLRMAARLTGRTRVLVAEHISPDKLAVMRNYCTPALQLETLPCSHETGAVDTVELKCRMSRNVAGVYFENPSYLGCIAANGDEISEIAHGRGALSLVGVDPISLGVIKPPAQYGADIVTGDLQGLGVPMYYGGALAGFIATRDEARFVEQFPSRLFSISRTRVAGEYGFGDVLYDERTSFGARENGKEFVGTHAALWGITAAVYLATLGPQGIKRLGQTILQNSQYAMKELAAIPGLALPMCNAAQFKEFVVDFGATGLSVAEVNERLLEANIFGGKALAGGLPGFENCALFCVTEIHTRQDIDRLVEALQSILLQ